MGNDDADSMSTFQAVDCSLSQRIAQPILPRHQQFDRTLTSSSPDGALGLFKCA